MTYLPVLVSFCPFAQTRITREEESPPPDWPVGRSVGHCLDGWLILDDPIPYGWGHPWAWVSVVEESWLSAGKEDKPVSNCPERFLQLLLLEFLP